MDPDPADIAAVTELLGRAPRGRFEVVVRDGRGSPVVMRNEPLLDDGTPMPTRYWLCDRDLNRRIGRLEAGGGVRDAEAAVDADELAAAHDRVPGRARCRAARGLDRPHARSAGSVAPDAASSACTPTTPGTWPAATTPSAGGSHARLDADTPPENGDTP